MDKESSSVNRELCAIGQDLSFRIDEQGLEFLLTIMMDRWCIMGRGASMHTMMEEK